jgi:hypothetical protein
MAWSANKSIQSLSMKGRWTFDTATSATAGGASTTTVVENSQRLIYDVTDPLHPKRLVSAVPLLTKYPIRDVVAGHDQYFDDSGSVFHNDTIRSLEFNYGLLRVTGFRMSWLRCGLQSEHGSVLSRFSIRQRRIRYTFQANERIVEVGIGSVTLFGKRRVTRVRLVTNMNHTVIAGYGKSEEVAYSAKNIIAFHERVEDGTIQKLGVTALDA